MKYHDPVPEHQNLIVVSGETVRKAAKLVEPLLNGSGSKEKVREKIEAFAAAEGLQL